MLKTPHLISDTISDMIASAMGGLATPKLLGEGFVEVGHFSLDVSLWGRNSPELHMGWPDLGDLHCCGVVDTPDQFITRYQKQLADDVRTFVVSFTHIAKDVGEAANNGGWRWHKWGQYLGEGKPTCEYLDDEEGFDAGVYVYHVYQTAGPELPPPEVTG